MDPVEPIRTSLPESRKSTGDPYAPYMKALIRKGATLETNLTYLADIMSIVSSVIRTHVSLIAEQPWARKHFYSSLRATDGKTECMLNYDMFTVRGRVATVDELYLLKTMVQMSLVGCEFDIVHTGPPSCVRIRF